MPYKPRIIIFLSLLYLFSPPFILASSSYVSMVPLTGPSSIISRLNPGDISVLLCYYLIALFLFSVRNWGWWGFVFSSLYLVGYNIRGYILNPFYTPLSLLLYTVLLTGAAALLFRKELIAPYFNPRLRWWETEKRYELSFQCKMNLNGYPVTVPIADISRGGCFIATGRPAPIGLVMTMNISINGLFLTLKGEVVRGSHSPVKGWGILFKDVSMIENRGLKELIHLLRYYHGDIKGSGDKRMYNRYTNPYYVYLAGPAVKGDGRVYGIIENFSRSGFCLQLDDSDWLTEDYRVTLELPHSLISNGKTGIEKPLPARIVWSKTWDDIYSLGAEFTVSDRKEKRRIERIVHDFKKMGGRERRKGRERDTALIEESLLLTPRGKIHSIFTKAN